MQRQTGSHIQAVQLILFGLGKRAVGGVLHDDMAGSAGALPAAGVLQLNAEMHGDVQNRLRLSMFVVGQLAGFEFDGAIDVRERYFRHTFIVASRSGTAFRKVVA